MLLVQYGNGFREDRRLSDFVGREIKGVFKTTQRNPDQVMRPIDDFLKAELPDVIALL